jgi:hypothetical protein
VSGIDRSAVRVVLALCEMELVLGYGLTRHAASRAPKKVPSAAWAARGEAAEECYAAASPELLARIEREGGPTAYIQFVVENVMRDVARGEHPFPGRSDRRGSSGVWDRH